MAETSEAQRAGYNDTGLAIDLGRSSSPSSQHELPLLAPLSHDHPLLRSSQPFDVDEFLLSRPNMSLHDLRFELRSFLGELKEELVQLINDDYAAFISLSTDLRGEGARLERLHWPLASLKGEIQKSRSELLDVQAAVQHKLAERAALREKKALLQLLMKLSDSVVRLESLLMISSPQDSVAGVSMTSTDLANVGMRDGGGLSIGLQLTGADDDNRDDRSRPGQAKHLARVATEYTQLLYHAQKARSEKCAFVEEVQWASLFVDCIK
ncbi:hypothetical protein FRC02_002532 [Tulasnella sp. 418]|nr:hypothetical protein FRC02_002532 [Tulasnella sp. 418]